MLDVVKCLREHQGENDLPWRACIMDEAADEIERLRDRLKPFAEIARRLGWDKLPDDAMEIGDHVVEAPADDISPGASYCLMVGAFREAALGDEQSRTPGAEK